MIYTLKKCEIDQEKQAEPEKQRKQKYWTVITKADVIQVYSLKR